MLKTYEIIIPLSFAQSFELIRKSGDDIVSWRNSNADPESGYIDWKQSFWSLTGSSLITAQVKQQDENQTSVTISVHKPLQVMDPFGICRRIFKKLYTSLENTIAKNDAYKDVLLKINE